MVVILECRGESADAAFAVPNSLAPSAAGATAAPSLAQWAPRDLEVAARLQEAVVVVALDDSAVSVVAEIAFLCRLVVAVANAAVVVVSAPSVDVSGVSRVGVV